MNLSPPSWVSPLEAREQAGGLPCEGRALGPWGSRIRHSRGSNKWRRPNRLMQTEFDSRPGLLVAEKRRAEEHDHKMKWGFET